ncbi:Asp-tRNA(Asn)/Glu-tRNA(Gln) amidotransferase subunit GatC [Isoalcanivorax indicus]|uniref:Asp-tRNA(Asn)/Glu-tRNA(Gln) amidotransferase subunit GatC n=1 Tax=Isoalcanivorax indicus TaxID=2202653 RepID=UPI000DBA6920|nr:Asp-tRNA(Asn)/Glu-tRNA(Gln) amidotransferase subunit GatC [Isoalcanivorax indicus]
MALDPKALSGVAHLARLHLDPADTDALTERLNSILGMVDRLQEADVTDVAPLAHPLDATQPLRDDTVSEADIREQVQPLAPATGDGCYLVPRVIE